jgi:hypothetical protein
VKNWRCRSSIGKAFPRVLAERYGDALLCVRYRYDGNGMRITTVELEIDRAKVVTPTKAEEMPGLTTLPRGKAMELLRKLGYAPHLSEKEKAKIVDKAEAILRCVL